MSNEFGKGLYPVEDNISYSVKDVGISRNMFLRHLGRSEQEDAAGRIVYFSGLLDAWAGVSVAKICEMMKEDLAVHEAREKANTAIRENAEREAVAEKKSAEHRFWCRMTLGIYGLFAKAPESYTAPIIEVKEVPFSVVYVWGPNAVFTGIRELIEKGLLKLEKMMEDGKEIDVLFPTEALIAKAMLS
jgi:hypothetical protein